jgi:hypothetical protein
LNIGPLTSFTAPKIHSSTDEFHSPLGFDKWKTLGQLKLAATMLL